MFSEHDTSGVQIHKSVTDPGIGDNDENGDDDDGFGDDDDYDDEDSDTLS